MVFLYLIPSPQRTFQAEVIPEMQDYIARNIRYIDNDAELYRLSLERESRVARTSLVSDSEQ